MFARRLYYTLFWTVIFLKNYRVEGGGSTFWPWTPRQLMDEANVKFDEGDHRAALYLAGQAIERDKTPKAEYHEMKGKCYAKMNLPHKAIDSFMEVLKITPDDEDNRILLARALFESERFREAVDQIILSVNDNPITLMANELYEKGVYKHVIRCYDEMIKRYPDKAELYNIRGKCHVEMEELDEAVSDFQAALSKNSEDEDSLLQLSKVLFHSGRFNEIVTGMLAGLGNEFYATEKYENALKCYDALVLKKPELAEVYARRALCFRKIDKLQNAIVDFEKMIQLPGHQLHYRIDFAEVLHEIGKDLYAAKVLENLSEKNLWDEEYTRLGTVLHKIQGNTEIEEQDLITA